MLLKMSMALIATVLAAGSAHADVIVAYDTSGIGISGQGPAGVGPTELGMVRTWGETFANPVNGAQLESFSLFLRGRAYGSGPLKLRGYVGEWDGSKVSRLLFESPTATMNATGHLQEFSFNPSVILGKPGTYVAFLSVANVGPQPDSSFFMPTTNGNVSAGDMVFTAGLDASAWHSTWAVQSGSSEQWFKARITDGFAPTPEPASLTLLGLGVFLTTIQARRKSASGRT